MNMKEIKKELNKKLEYQMDIMDNHILLNTIHINPFIENTDGFLKFDPISKKEYKLFEGVIDEFQIKRNNYIIFASTDISGFDYWQDNSINELDLNYITISIQINTMFKESDIKDLLDDIELFIDTLIEKLPFIDINLEYLY